LNFHLLIPSVEYLQLSSNESDEDDSNVSFAPKDVCPINFEPKENLHGIGYRGLDPRLALGHFSNLEPSAVSTKVGRKGIRGQVSNEHWYILFDFVISF
jgi:hypothetical protein